MPTRAMEKDLPSVAARGLGAVPGPQTGLDGILGRIGKLEVRLARDASEIAAAQAVRYRVFYEELGARGQVSQHMEQRDSDSFDAVCDHLLVFDTALPMPEHKRIVGTYRLLRQEIANTAGGFYSTDEFELDTLVARHADRRFLELGRSCVLPEYRSKRTVELLWQGIWAYIHHHRVDVMTGCASFPGTVPAAHARALSYLAHNCGAEGEWRVRAVAERYQNMDLMPNEAIDSRSALAEMPPLIKGYMRVGARFGDGCVIDDDFCTTDVLVVLPVEWIAGRYVSYYGGDSQRFAA